MLFDFIFLSVFVFGWLLCGYVPWVVLSIVTRGHAGLGSLPVTLLAALVAGLSVPILFRQDALGAAISMGVALIAAIAVLAAKRAATGAWIELTPKPPEDRP